MNPNAPLFIVGAGIAGACAAYHLSRQHPGPVHVFEADRPAAGASRAAAGLVNPLMGRRANPVWRLDAALDAIHNLLEDAGAPELLRGGGVLRPTVEEKQVAFFQDAASAYPNIAQWLSDAELQERAPDVHSVDGGLWIPRGGAIDVPRFVEHLLEASRRRGATVHTKCRVTGWREVDGSVRLTVQHLDEAGESVETVTRSGGWVLLCLGQGYPSFSELTDLGLTGVKGQTVVVRRPRSAGNGPIVPKSGRGYIVPRGDGTLTLGSSYDHDFDSLDPDPDQTDYILRKTSKMLPGLEDAEVLEVTAGVRVKHEQSHLPLLGPLPHRSRVWIFSALGSKGLLTAPLLASRLYAYAGDPTAIPHDVRVPRPAEA